MLTFQCLPLFLPSYLFHFPFLFSLSLSLSSSFFVFLPSLFSIYFASFGFLVFVSLLLCLVSLLLFHIYIYIKILILKVLPSILSVFCFLSCFVFQIPFPYLCSFLIVSCVFCSTLMFFLAGLAIRNANRRDPRELFRGFARIDSQKNIYFHNVRAIRANRLKPAIRNFKPPQSAIRKKKGVQFGRPETIRENQAIRANLRIDSRESGHLRCSCFDKRAR